MYNKIKMSFKALFINLENKTFKIKPTKIWGPIDFAVNELSKRDVFCFGRGPLAGTILQGAGRLIFIHRSPLWKGIFISTLGGAARALFKTGINFIVLENRAKKPLILLIKRSKNKLDCKFFEIDKEKLNLGVFKFEKWIYKNFAKEFVKENLDFRILATGPAALKTNFGAIGSTKIDKGKLGSSTSWAGRGGFGSALVQKFNVLGIIFGGDFKEEQKINYKDLEILFQEEFNNSVKNVIFEATKKYRYDPALKSGGTFGGNFTTCGSFLKILGNWFLSFNWKSTQFKEEERNLIYNKLIKNHYLAQFNKEIIKPKSFTTCGDICSAVCKKIYERNGIYYKKDYEPYEAAGPNCGIFDQRAAEKLVHQIDDLGFDAIEAGNMISWIMELLDKRLIKKEDFALPFYPKFTFENFDPVKDSEKNSKLAISIIKKLILKHPDIFGKGIRYAAKYLSKLYKNKEILNSAVYIPNGKEGCIAPTQYWVPGVFLPLTIQGKYYEIYGPEFYPPKELGKESTKRFIKELYSGNTGLCRFHRKWAEKIIEKITNLYLGKQIDYYNHHKKLVKKIIRLNKKLSKPCFWESEKVIDIIFAYLKKASDSITDPELEKLVKNFETDKIEAAKNYWNQVIKGVEEELKK